MDGIESLLVFLVALISIVTWLVLFQIRLSGLTKTFVEFCSARDITAAQYEQTQKELAAALKKAEAQLTKTLLIISGRLDTLEERTAITKKGDKQ
jgi:hypothetical protein